MISKHRVTYVSRKTYEPKNRSLKYLKKYIPGFKTKSVYLHVGIFINFSKESKFCSKRTQLFCPFTAHDLVTLQLFWVSKHRKIQPNRDQAD